MKNLLKHHILHIIPGLIFVVILLTSSMSFALEQADLGDNEILVKNTDDVAQIINDAAEDDILVFDVGTYSLNLVIDKSLTLRGVSTADVKLKKAETDIVIDVINGANVTIKNFMFISTGVAIRVTSSTADIKNNIFSLGSEIINEDAGVAIQTDRLSDITIKYNVFYDVLTAIESLVDDRLITVNNNIFALLNDSDNAVWFRNVFSSDFSYNCFNTAESTYSSSAFDIVNPDLGFVDEAANDFHLQSISVCKDAGETIVIDNVSQVSDIGAYGGIGADKYAFPISVTSVKAGVSNDGVSSVVDVSWKENKDYRINGYKVYYSDRGIQSLGSLAVRTSLNSISVASDIFTVSVSSLDLELIKPNAPELLSVLPISSGKVAVTWNKINTATNYTLSYQKAGGSIVSQSTGDVDRYEVSGLTNNINYSFWLTANNEYKYYFQVVGLIENGGETVEGLFVNSDFEYSDVTKNEISEKSSVLNAMPESLVPYPVLPNEGCFIATAAFGFYSHSQVQILRDFRDNYLLTNEMGAAFVAWYYHYGPTAAAFINEYEILKPVVRVALYPLILLAKIIAYDVMFFWGLIVLLFFAIAFLLKNVCRTFISVRSKNGIKSC